MIKGEVLVIETKRGHAVAVKLAVIGFKGCAQSLFKN